MVEIEPKSRFFGFFKEVFCLRLLRPYELRTIFLANEKRYRDNRGKFHQYSICGCQVIHFQFFTTDSASMKWSFSGIFWGPYSPKDSPILFKFSSEILKQKNSVWAIFQKFELSLKWEVAKVYIFGPFLDPIYPRKIKNVAKNQNASTC